MYIALEGIDGSGTSTQAELLAAHLAREDISFLQATEPSSGPLGKILRIALSEGNLDPFALQILFCADRQEQLSRVIDPALSQGTFVLSDRSYLSTLAYAHASGLPLSGLTALASEISRPEIIFYLDIPALTALERLSHRSSSRDIFETQDFQERVSQSYQAVIQLLQSTPQLSQQIITLDADQPPHHIHQEILSHLS